VEFPKTFTYNIDARELEILGADAIIMNTDTQIPPTTFLMAAPDEIDGEGSE
jgi:hypothetical protein